MKRGIKVLEAFDAVDGATGNVKRYGKNFESLVVAGAWTIVGFSYKHSKCSCCGRPIVRTLVLENQAHDAAVKLNADYKFSQRIDIGLVCGPRVFEESCTGFYSDPAREWERQWKIWQDFIKHAIFCAKMKEVWALVPQAVAEPFDEMIVQMYNVDGNTGSWWMLRDGKERLIKVIDSIVVRTVRNMKYTSEFSDSGYGYRRSNDLWSIKNRLQSVERCVKSVEPTMFLTDVDSTAEFIFDGIGRLAYERFMAKLP
jgi:hypothetical protein